MPRTGRPATPIEIKRRRGTLRKDRHPAAVEGTLALAPAETAPERGPIAEALLAAGAGAWLSTVDDAVLLPLIDEAWAERRSLMQRWVGSDFRDEQAARRLKTVEENLTKWLSLAGLTPTDRARLGLAEVKARSKLEELADRRAKRAGRPAS